MKNIKLIQTIILCIFIIGIVSSAGINTYYNLNLNYDKGQLTLLSNNIDQSRELINNSFGLYYANILDYNDNIIGIYFFNIPLTALYDNIDENGTISGGGEVELDEVNFTLFIPYEDNATKIVIYNENASKKLEIDFAFYSKKYEEYKEFNNSNTINQNISIPSNNNNISVTDNKNTLKEENFLDKFSQYWWALLIILLILLGIIINYIRK